MVSAGNRQRSGYIRNFPDWLRKNGYSIQLKINEYANIMDSSNHVIGIVHTLDLPEGLESGGAPPARTGSGGSLGQGTGITGHFYGTKR